MINPRSTHSYVSPKLVEGYSLRKVKHNKSWLVQLATGTKRKVSEVVVECPIELNGLHTHADLNVLPLGYYDVLIGMDWLERHRAKVECYEKALECLDDEGLSRLVKGIPKHVSIR